MRLKDVNAQVPPGRAVASPVMVGGRQSTPVRVVFYSHDSQGLGHFRRNRSLAQALVHHLPQTTGREVTGLLINGVDGSSGAQTPRGFDVLTLPAVGKRGADYGPRHLDLALGAVTDLRGDVIEAALESIQPDLVVIDRHALGIDGELSSALRSVRRTWPHCRVVLGLRDVLDAPSALAREWASVPSALVAELFDEIWVYGDPTVHDLRRTGELPVSLHSLVRYQGYLSKGRASLAEEELEPERPYLVTTAGGGSDGLRLCRVAARAQVPAGYRHVVITGPQMPDADYRTVEREAGAATTVVHSVDDASRLIADSAASISMAGYNTVCETLATDVPALLVPREWPRTEQLIRAEGLARQGVVDLLRANDLTPAAVSQWWADAVTRRVPRDQLGLEGLTNVADAAARLVTSTHLTEEMPHDVAQ